MARAPAPTRESVPEKYRALYDEVVRERGGPPTTGPGTVHLNSPEVAKRAGHLSAYLRQESGLLAKIQELAMLTTSAIYSGGATTITSRLHSPRIIGSE